MSSYDDLTGLVTFRPLSMRLPEPTYSGWGGSPFSASWTSTVDKLVDEIRHLKPRQTISKFGRVRAALMATHPDRGGDPAEFADVQAAREEEHDGT